MFNFEKLSNFNNKDTITNYENELKLWESQLGKNYPVKYGHEIVSKKIKIPSLNPSNHKQIIGYLDAADTNDINNAIKIFTKDTSRSVVSFTKINSHPEWCFRQVKKEIFPIMGWEKYSKRSQDIEDTYELNGLIYIATPDFLRCNKSFINSNTRPLIIKNKIEVLDIDTEDDFDYAEQELINRK